LLLFQVRHTQVVTSDGQIRLGLNHLDQALDRKIHFAL
jgi:hypothetical protein